MLSTVNVRRAYYHCLGCSHGQLSKDNDLDIVGTSFSHGAKRMIGRVGHNIRSLLRRDVRI